MIEDTDINDPEDAYDATDPPRERLRNFVRRIMWIDEHLDIERPVMHGRIERLLDDIEMLRAQM